VAPAQVRGLTSIKPVGGTLRPVGSHFGHVG
jgi:hypothetical protein